MADSMNPPQGAAYPTKPVHELYAESLLEAGQTAQAIKMFEISLRRTPNRPLSLLGLARAQVKMGNAMEASEPYKKLTEIWENKDFPEVLEAKRHLASF